GTCASASEKPATSSPLRKCVQAEHSLLVHKERATDSRRRIRLPLHLHRTCTLQVGASGACSTTSSDSHDDPSEISGRLLVTGDAGDLDATRPHRPCAATQADPAGARTVEVLDRNILAVVLD